MIKAHQKHIPLDFPAPTKRKFPKDNPTATPKFNSCKPKAYNDKELTPLKDNSYSNNYHKSTTRMEPCVRESAVNNLIRPQ